MDRVVVDTAAWVRRAGRAERAVEIEAVDARLEYDPDDPFAVTVRIGAGEAAIAWVLARDLLADGLRSRKPVGEGHIRVQATSVLTEVTRLDDDGSAELLRLPWWNVREFLRATVAVVPRGEEACDVDAWITALTAPQEP